MIFGGTLDRFPKLKLLATRGGSFLPAADLTSVLSGNAASLFGLAWPGPATDPL